MPRNNTAFMKPVQPSPVLAAVLGCSNPLPRSEITSRLWVYIREHGLQDATNRRQINADDTLRPLFGDRDSVTMFELPKCVSQHVSEVG